MATHCKLTTYKMCPSYPVLNTSVVSSTACIGDEYFLLPAARRSFHIEAGRNPNSDHAPVSGSTPSQARTKISWLSLRKLVAPLGILGLGDLVVVAKFTDGDIALTSFQDNHQLFFGVHGCRLIACFLPMKLYPMPTAC